MSEAIIEALRNRAKRFFSLDTPANPDLGEVATDVAAGFVPGVGTALSARDFERARREGDALGMGLSAAGMIPVAGGGVRAVTQALRKPRNMTVWHGAKDPTWIDRGEAFNPNMTANMPSKYLWTSPNQDTAKTYAGISEMQLEKAASGLGSAPSSTAGIRQMELDGSAKVLKVNDVKKTSKELGIEWGGENPLEMFLDAAKAKGYDAVQMKMDGGNIAVLNPSVVRYGPNMDAQIKALRKKDKDAAK